MKYVIFYEAAPDFMSKALQYFEQHRALWKQFGDAGTLLMIGPFEGEPAGEAMGVFTTREAAESFVAADPFVKHGVVAKWKLREWREALRP